MMAFRLSANRYDRNYRKWLQDHKTRIAVLVPLVVAAATRLVYATWAVTDFWGDSYHHWLISRLTLANDWAYADYKGLETVWLPGYHYLTAAIMAIWGRADLTPAHLANILLGILACGLLAWLVTRITHDWRAGLATGVTLALLPWHIAYSHMNMPEIFAGVLLLSTLLAAQSGRAALLAILAFASSLTRHELTLLLVPVAVWLAWRREWRALAGLALGSASGLLVWSAWSFHNEGDPLYWWKRYRALTAWDAQFWAKAGVRLTDLQTLWEAARTAFAPAIIVVLAALGAFLFPHWRRRVPREGWLMLALVMLHWSALGLGFVAGNLPSADPRYVLVSLPIIAGAGVVLIAALPFGKTRWAFSTVYALLLVSSLFRQLPDFRGMAYTLAPERAAGEFLGRTAPAESQFWVDAPVAIYFSGLEPGRFHSSDQLLPDTARERDDIAGSALDAVDTHDIEYVLWEDVSYTFVQRVWPQMVEREAFEQNGFRFEPVFQYSGWELDFGARPTKIWRVFRTDADE
jgi:hypothetical protein